MPTFLQFTALPFRSLADTMFLAGTTLSDQAADSFRIAGNGYVWSFGGRGLTYDAQGNVTGGLIDGWSLRQGSPDGTPGIMTASTNFHTMTPAILTQALAIFAGGDPAGAAALLTGTWEGEYLSYTTWVGGRFAGSMQGDGISMGGAPSTAWGEGGSDTITLSGNDDRGYGGGDADWLYGQTGNDLLFGGADDDHLYGGGDGDRLWGEIGNDVIDAGRGNDTLRGGEGDDTLWASHGDDRLTGDSGNDTLDAGAGHDVLDGGAGDDSLSGRSGDDRLIGATGDDSLAGQGGFDVLHGGLSEDRLDGGTEDDTVWGGTGNDRLSGGRGDDSVFGGADNDLLFGQTGADLLSGGGGDDRLDGGAGNDTLAGGGGGDTFVIARFAGDADTLTDFADGIDRIDLRAHGFADEAAALAAAAETGGDVILTLADGQVLTIRGTGIAALAGDLIL